MKFKYKMTASKIGGTQGAADESTERRSMQPGEAGGQVIRSSSRREVPLATLLDSLEQLDADQLERLKYKTEELISSSGSQSKRTHNSTVVFQQTANPLIEQSTQTDDSWFRETVMTRSKHPVVQHNNLWDG